MVKTWSMNCPDRECETEWYNDDEYDDIEERRRNYRRLSNWTLICEECGHIYNTKRPF